MSDDMWPSQPAKPTEPDTLNGALIVVHSEMTAHGRQYFIQRLRSIFTDFGWIDTSDLGANHVKTSPEYKEGYNVGYAAGRRAGPRK